MADVVVSEGGEADTGTPAAAAAAHEAAVAEGASGVQAEQAQAAAAEASAAAEVALAAAEANIEAGAAVEGAVATANESAAQATVSAEMVHEALSAQTAAITALAEELKRGRESAPKPEKVKTAPDKAPSQGHGYYNRKLFGGRG